MVKQKKRSKRGRQPRRQKVVRLGALSRWDAPAREYLRLLRDPCNAPLVQPVVPGTSAGILWRARSSVTIPLVGTDTSCVVYYAPNNAVFLCSVAAASTPLITPNLKTALPLPTTPVTNTWYYVDVPCISFVERRSIAACLQASYRGVENNRAGTFSVHSNFPHRRIQQVVGLTPDMLAGMCPVTIRTPLETSESVWMPSEPDDVKWREKGHLVGDADVDETGVLLVLRNATAANYTECTAYNVWDIVPDSTTSNIGTATTIPSRVSWTEIISEAAKMPMVRQVMDMMVVSATAALGPGARATQQWLLA